MEVLSMSKSDFRESAKNILVGIPSEDRDAKSYIISGFLKHFLQTKFKNKKITLGVYAPLRFEVKWYLSFLQDLDAYTWAWPLLDQKGSTMEFFLAKDNSEIITSGQIGLYEQQLLDNKKVLPDILIVPGLMFSQNRERLGRGGGYYDKYTHQFQGLKIGVGFWEQVSHLIPTQKHDQKSDYLITDNCIYYEFMGARK
jgi:5-formyltetrahydrofolate cyclo-ligase